MEPSKCSMTADIPVERSELERRVRELERENDLLRERLEAAEAERKRLHLALTLEE